VCVYIERRPITHYSSKNHCDLSARSLEARLLTPSTAGELQVTCHAFASLPNCSLFDPLPPRSFSLLKSGSWQTKMACPKLLTFQVQVPSHHGKVILPALYLSYLASAWFSSPLKNDTTSRKRSQKHAMPQVLHIKFPLCWSIAYITSSRRPVIKILCVLFSLPCQTPLGAFKLSILSSILYVSLPPLSL
jgi:hypothetical protein